MKSIRENIRLNFLCIFLCLYTGMKIIDINFCLNDNQNGNLFRQLQVLDLIMVKYFVLKFRFQPVYCTHTVSVKN